MHVCIAFAAMMPRTLPRRSNKPLEHLNAHTEDKLVAGRRASMVFAQSKALVIAGWLLVLTWEHRMTTAGTSTSNTFRLLMGWNGSAAGVGNRGPSGCRQFAGGIVGITMWIIGSGLAMR